VAVASDRGHRFSKPVQDRIVLEGYGVKGDAHADLVRLRRTNVTTRQKPWYPGDSGAQFDCSILLSLLLSTSPDAVPQLRIYIRIKVKLDFGYSELLSSPKFLRARPCWTLD
jgi:hypothetical protein